ncbi:hypothetical protein MYX78_02095 [Acidobacteria bacterium AH-259-G07]|nr:hypothetical protein [Acidobacteria bacterium AH-259-G07]
MTRRGFFGAALGAAAVGNLQYASFGKATQIRGRVAGRLRAGAATSNITPALGVSLDGITIEMGPSTHVHDELYARCLVLDNGWIRVALVVCDCCLIDRRVFDKAKRLLLRQAGIPVDHTLMSATHTYSAPRVLPVSESPVIWPQHNPQLHREYAEFLSSRIADGVRRACQNLQPAQVGWGVRKVPDYVHNRRWYMKPGTIQPNPFGRKSDQVQTSPPWKLWPGPPRAPNLVAPAGPTDPELSVLGIRSLDGRPLALLANYSTDCAGFRIGWDPVRNTFIQEEGIPRGHVSADYFGVFAKRIRHLLNAEYQDPPFVGVMSNGTSGDIEPIDRRKKPNRYAPYGRVREVGNGLAKATLAIYEELDFFGRLPLEVRHRTVRVNVRLPSRDEVARARETISKAPTGELTRDQIYARETLLMSRRAPSYECPIQSVRIGDLGIVAIPCEVFAETGLAIKARSPLQPTFTIGLANDYAGYLPPPKQHRLGGYETWRSRSSFLEIEAEPKLVAEALQLLADLESV